MSVYEMATMYYPRLWDDKRIDALVKAGKLTEEETAAIRADDSQTAHAAL